MDTSAKRGPGLKSGCQKRQNTYKNGTAKKRRTEMSFIRNAIPPKGEKIAKTEAKPASKGKYTRNLSQTTPIAIKRQGLLDFFRI